MPDKDFTDFVEDTSPSLSAWVVGIAHDESQEIKIPIQDLLGATEGDVSSVFGRTGVVTAQSGDYTAEQISETATAKILTSDERTKLGNIEAGADVTDATNIASSIHGVSEKTTPVDADTVGIVDSAAANVLKKLSWATLKTYFDTLYNNYVHPNHSGDVTSSGDGATTIANDTVTNAKSANMAANTVKGRNTDSTGDPEDIAVSALTEEVTPATGSFLLGWNSSGKLRKIAHTNVGIPETTSLAAVYVSKSGNDSNSGLTPSQHKLTFGSAITAASSLITAGATGVTIHGLDGGTYAIGTISVPSNVAIVAPGAIFEGGIVISTNASVRIRGHYPLEAQNDGIGVNFSMFDSGPAYYEVDFLDQRGTATVGIQPPELGDGTGIIFVKVNTAHYVGTGSGVGIQVPTGYGHLHYRAADLYLAGNNAIGITVSTGSVIGSIDHILELGTPTGTTAIKLDGASTVNLVVGEIIADTAYNIISGSLYLNCPKITGTKTGTATFIPGDALKSGTLDQFSDVTQTGGATLAISANTSLNGGTHSGTNTGDQDLSGYSLTSHTHTGVYDLTQSAINGASAKTTPVDADTVGLIDSADSNTLKEIIVG